MHVGLLVASLSFVFLISSIIKLHLFFSLFSQFFNYMDCKPTFISLKLTHLTPPFSGDFSAVNAASGDDFSVEDLLNFPTDANFLQENHNPRADGTNTDEPTNVSPAKTPNDGETTVPESQLRLPVNDVGDLEWVSQFVDVSFSGDFLLPFPARKLPEMSPATETETVTLVDVNPSFGNSVNKRVRSKRRRTGGSVWSLRSSSPATDCSTTSSSSASSCTSKPLLFAEDILGEPAVQVKRRRIPARVGGSGRRCSHCLVQKTPQWRTGPLGAKTLCNACGVRFKSGRLLPEYRPACSPTFSSEMHSNNHWKVLEMRRKKAVEMAGCGGLTGSD